VVERNPPEERGRLAPEVSCDGLSVGSSQLIDRGGWDGAGCRLRLDRREGALRQAEVVQDKEPQEPEAAGRLREQEELPRGL
jgi:hypothetical protein